MPYLQSHGRPRAPQTLPKWQQGDIAFLKHFDQYSHRDHTDLIASGYLHKAATCHPVILLAVHNNKAIITPVSAFRTEEQSFLPPWEQKWHQSKNRDHFRAFVGTRRPNNSHAALRLADSNMGMPKPQASWVYAQSFFCVPFSVLGWFNKSPALLRVHPDSLEQLKGDIRTSFPREHQQAGARLRGCSAAPQSSRTTRTTPAQTPPQIACSAPATSSSTSGSWAAITRPAAIRPRHLAHRSHGIRAAS